MTATGDIVFDFKPEEDAAPYVNENLAFKLDSPRTLSGLMSSMWTMDGRIVFYEPFLAYGDVRTAVIEKNNGSDGGGECGPGLYDPDGNGYELKCSYDEFRIHKVLAWQRQDGGALAGQVNSAYATNENLLLQIDGSNSLVAKLGTDVIGFGELIDLTYPANTLRPGGFSDRNASGSSGVYSFAASGVAAGNSLDTLSSPVSVGGIGYSGTTTGMDAITSLTNATITSSVAGSFAFSMDGFTHLSAYPLMGTQVFTVSDGSKTATKSSVIQPMEGWTAVVMGDAIDRGIYSIGQDTDISEDDEVHLPTSAGTLNADGTLSDFVFGTYGMWRRRKADGLMYSSTLTVTNSGIVPPDPEPGTGASLANLSLKNYTLLSNPLRSKSL